MAGKPGRSGTNKNQDRPWKEALMLAVNERMGDQKKLRLLANKLVDKALEGDVQALKEIGDRMDGKPRQEIEATVETHNYVAEVPVVNKDSDSWAAQHAPKTIM